MSVATPVPAATPMQPKSSASGAGVRTVIDDFLDEQAQLTAVESFSRWHAATPSQSKYYQRLLPATSPQAGEQYAFEVDLDRCSGCKACVTACHSLNGLDEGESFRDVGLLLGGSWDLPVIQHVTTACHHCLEPACAIACPVNAYEKDPVTGIVRHLDDQCFGCQYCTLACPYDVPKYHATKGIVRKCDLCSDRLKVGEAPACVQACPHEAIRINVVSMHRVVDDAASRQFLPGAPDPQLTFPTTTYKTTRVFPRNVVAADLHAIRHEHAPWSLIIMLVLTQLAVGTFAVEFWLTSEWGYLIGTGSQGMHRLGTVTGFTAMILGGTALAAATLHLGRPFLAYRAVVGLAHSWLSREIVAFGLFAKLSVLYATSNWWMPWLHLDPKWRAWLGLSVVVSGLVGVACSVMIYHATRRPFWNGPETATKFLGTCLLLGLSIAVFGMSISHQRGFAGDASLLLEQSGTLLWKAIMLLVACKLIVDLRVLTHLADRTASMQKRSAQLLTGEFPRVLATRIALTLVGGIAIPLIVLSTKLEATTSPWLLVSCGLSTTCLLLGEFAERYLFFSAVVSHRMPGGLTT